LVDWAESGKIEYVKSPGGHRRYPISAFETLVGQWYSYLSCELIIVARKKKVFGVRTVTRKSQVGTLELNRCKSDELDLISSRLGLLRSDLWNEFGSLKAWGVSEYAIDKLLRPFNSKYQLPAKLWEATLYDMIGDIHAVQASCIEKVLDKLNLKYQLNSTKKSVAQHVLESDEWRLHPKLSKLVRSIYQRGHTKVSNQIVVKAYDCQTDSCGLVWIRFGGLVAGRTLKLPTTLKAEIKGQFRLIKRSGNWYIHYTTDIEKEAGEQGAGGNDP
jgi:hypothetical protein